MAILNTYLHYSKFFYLQLIIIDSFDISPVVRKIEIFKKYIFSGFEI